MERRRGMVLLLAVMGAWAPHAGCARGALSGAEEPTPQSAAEGWSDVELARWNLRRVTPERRRVQGAVRVPATVQLEDARRALVHTPVPGEVRSIPARLGLQVRRGAPLLELTAPSLAEAQAAVVRAEAEKQRAALAHQRSLALIATGGAARSAADDTQAAFRRATAELERSRAAARWLEGARLSSGGRLVLRSPIDGEVMSRNVTLGEFVRPPDGASRATPLVQVGNLDELIGSLWLDPSEIGLVSVGTPVRLRVTALPARSFEARIEWVGSAVDAMSGRLPARVRLANASRALLPGMQGVAELPGPEHELWGVPPDAVIRSAGHASVLVITGRDGDRVRTEWRPVRELADGDRRPDEEQAWIVDGIEPGEEVLAGRLTAFADEAHGRRRRHTM